MGPAVARVGAAAWILVTVLALWSPVALAADNHSAPPPVHLPLRHGPAHARSALSAGAPQGYIPCDIQRAYHMDLLHASQTTGANQLIAIVDAFDDPNAASDLHAFDAAFGLPDPAFQVSNLGAAAGSAINNGWDHEIDLDVQWAHAMAPGAGIALVEVADSNIATLIGGVVFAVNTLGADVVSMSWGTAGEFFSETTLDASLPPTNPGGKPVMYVASAGDLGFGTAWPAASPQVLSVGGTSVAPSAVGYDTQQSHFSCSGMSASAGVTSQNETVWGSPTCTSSSCPGTGGGTSSVEPKPQWQLGFGVPGGRSMPDMAMLADPSSGVAVFTNGAWSPYQWGGTSLAAPLWAGVIAMLNQQRHANSLDNLSISPSSFWAYQLPAVNDVVSGASPGYSGDVCQTTAACTGAPGYDQVTGRGTPLGSVSWQPLGGSISSAPDAASPAPGRLDVFARGSDNALWTRTLAGGQWGGWQTLGGSLTSAPGAVAWSAKRLDVFVRGSDGGLWHRWRDGNAWSGWESLGGVLSSGPAATSWAEGRLDVFARGTDNALWHRWWAGAGWSSWESQGGSLAAEPGAVSWGPGRIDVFARATDNQLSHRWWDGQRWNGWDSFGGFPSSGAAVASAAAGQLDVFSLTANGRVQHRAYAGRWGDWMALSGQWASSPGAVSQGTGTVDVFEQGSDGQLWHTTIPSPVL
jgi:Repeat of unknown function (DUF346)